MADIEEGAPGDTEHRGIGGVAIAIAVDILISMVDRDVKVII